MTIKHMVFFGCSFTKGLDSAYTENIVDHPHLRCEKYDREAEIKAHKEENTYPYLLAKRHGVTYENLAFGGNANDVMAVQAYDWLYRNQNRVDETLCIFAATSPYRFSTTYIPNGRRNIKISTKNLKDRATTVIGSGHESDYRLKEMANLLLDEDPEYFKTTAAFQILGVKRLFNIFKANHCIINMLFPDQDTGPHLEKVNLFDSENQRAIVERVTLQAKIDTGNHKKYYSPYTMHFNKKGYEVTADLVDQEIKKFFID